MKVPKKVLDELFNVELGECETIVEYETMTVEEMQKKIRDSFPSPSKVIPPMRVTKKDCE